MRRFLLLIGLTLGIAQTNTVCAVDDKSPLIEKAAYLQQVLIERHWLDGLYVGIIDSPPPGAKLPLPHTVNQPGNVIHAGVWTGRYLGGEGYQYAVTKDPRAREIGGQILKALRIQQEVTGKPGLLCRGYVKGHGPVVGWERDGADSKEWHQGRGQYADYRFYSDVSVDNFNAVMYGYAIHFDLAADEDQKRYIAYDVDRLMTHVPDNDCRIIDLDGEPTQYGHIGIDPDPSRDDPKVAWFCDKTARTYLTLDGGKSWQSVTNQMMGAAVQNLAASPSRTFVLYAQTTAGVLLTRDGGLSWRTAPAANLPTFTVYDFKQPLMLASGATLRINESDELVRSTVGGKTSQLAMNGWRIPRAKSLFQTRWGIIASGPGVAYRSADGQTWEELKLWCEMETGPADFLHAYWMGRYYGFLE